MKCRIIGPLAALSLLSAAAMPVMAKTNIAYYSQFAPNNTVNFLPFTVTASGTFLLQTSGLNTIDPMIRLFTGTSWDGSGLGASFAVSDDDALAQPGWNACTGAGGTCHSFIITALSVGNYTLAMSTFDFTDADAQAGAKQGSFSGGHTSYCDGDQNWSDCGYDVGITSRDGTALVTPEPATMFLIAAGLAGIAVARRGRKSA